MIDSNKKGRYFLVKHFLGVAIVMAATVIALIASVNFSLGFGAAAALFAIAEPAWREANNTSQWGKSFKDLSGQEKKAMFIRMAGVTLALLGFYMGANGCG